eukprot:gene21461-27944_t
MRVSWVPQDPACSPDDINEGSAEHLAQINGDYFYQGDRSDERAYYVRNFDAATEVFTR